MRRIAILGGTFDPPHNAHVAMAKAALDGLPLAKVLFMPAPSPPHKRDDPLSPYPTRRKMTELAIQGEPGFELSLMEEFREGPSYTVELLEHYKRLNRDDDLYLILGADSAEELGTWKDPEKILELATLIVFPRTGYSSRIPVEGDAKVILFEEPVIDVSSTDIRDRYRRGESAVDLVPTSVNRFILDNSVYS